MRISDWSSDVCSSDLQRQPPAETRCQCLRDVQAHAGAAVATSEAGLEDVRQIVGGNAGALVFDDQAVCTQPHRNRRTHRRVQGVAQQIGEHRSDRARRRSEEHTSELQSLMRISYAVFCLKKKIKKQQYDNKLQKRQQTI